MKNKMKIVIVFILGILISTMLSTNIFIKIRPDKKVSYTEKKELKSTSDPDYINGVYSSSSTISSHITNLETKKFDTLVTWGDYKTVGTKLNLSSAVTNYRYIIVRACYNGDSYGIESEWLPVSLITQDYKNTYQINSYTNAWSHITYKFNSATQIEIKGNTNTGIGIRTVYGVN